MSNKRSCSPSTAEGEDEEPLPKRPCGASERGESLEELGIPVSPVIRKRLLQGEGRESKKEAYKRIADDFVRGQYRRRFPGGPEIVVIEENDKYFTDDWEDQAASQGPLLLLPAAIQQSFGYTTAWMDAEAVFAAAAEPSDLVKKLEDLGWMLDEERPKPTNVTHCMCTRDWLLYLSPRAHVYRRNEFKLNPPD